MVMMKTEITVAEINTIIINQFLNLHGGVQAAYFKIVVVYLSVEKSKAELN
jgi:RNase P/RNase MRP subunit POP5